jgi:hypothetical protein
MTTARWAISLLLVVHLTALGLGALPSPDRLAEVEEDRSPVDNPLAARVAPVLDRVASVVAPVPAALWNASEAVRPFAALYVNMTGLAQRWAMFSNPPTADQYLRVRYYVGSTNVGAWPSWTATELVFPARNEARIRVLQAYRDSYRDKAMAIALQRFHDHVAARPQLAELESNERSDQISARSAVRSGELPDDLAPIARYFGRQFAHVRLGAQEHILRTDVWWGVAPNQPPGASRRTDPGERQVVLQDYYEGAIERLGRIAAYPSYHTLERESDIVWRLEYFEEQ